jgi:hypothetical protein
MLETETEALGEVAGLAAKGKEKETYDGVVVKGKGVTTRQPLRNFKISGCAYGLVVCRRKL